MRRKAVDLVLALVLVVCVPFSVVAQQSRPVRVGFLIYSPIASYSDRLALRNRQALADLGWVDGRNLVIEGLGGSSDATPPSSFTRECE